MILTAHQPVYLPWLGLFHKIALAEYYCIFDIAQYQTKDFNNRNKIKTNAGPIWLTVPVESKDHYAKAIRDVRIVNDGWNRKHCKSIELAYKRAPFFEQYYPPLKDILSSEHTLLTELNTAILTLLLDQLGITIPIVYASNYAFRGSKSDLVLDMCTQLGADRYIFGGEGKNYADVESFLAAGVTPYFQEYKHPTYRQLHGKFEPYMSVIDLLYNEGPASLDVLKGENITSVLQQT